MAETLPDASGAKLTPKKKAAVEDAYKNRGYNLRSFSRTHELQVGGTRGEHAAGASVCMHLIKIDFLSIHMLRVFHVHMQCN